jgi:hypothetical protein
MLDKIIQFSVKNKLIIGVLTTGVILLAGLSDRLHLYFTVHLK